MFNDIQLWIQNSLSIAADTSNSSWFKFVKSICNHSIFNFKLVNVFKWFSDFRCGSVVQCRKLVAFLKFIYIYIYIYINIFIFVIQHLATWLESSFHYFSIIQFKFIFSYPQCILCLKIILKTYQFIYCFNSSFFSSSCHGNIYTFSYQEYNLFIQFTYGFNFTLVWTFMDVQFGV